MHPIFLLIPILPHHSLAETQDRKCFSMQLILVVGKMDMINQICQMLSFCWKLSSAYFAQKMITKYITKYSSNCIAYMY